MNLIKTPDQSVKFPMALWRCILYDPLPPFGSAEAYESSTLNQKCFATRTYHATTYINKQKSTTPRYRAPLTPISKTVVEIICWVHLFRSAVEIICLDQLLRCDLLRLSIETCYWGQSLTSTVEEHPTHILYIYIYIYIRFFYQRSQILSDSHSTCNLACCTNNYATFFFDCHPTVDFNRAPMQIKRTLAAKSRANANHEPKVGRTKIKFL